MTDRSEKALLTVGTLFHLVSIGLVGAATIILFGVASVLLLGTGKEPPTGSRIGGVFQYTDSNAKPISAPTHSPIPDSAKILPAFPPQRASTSETREVSGGKPGFELPSPDPDASTSASQARDAALIPGPAITKTESTEVSGSDESAEYPPIADEVSATPDASSRLIVPSEILNERRDQPSSNFEMQQNPPAMLGQHIVASDEKWPAQKGQNQRVHRDLPSPNAALRSRMQKECGPIVFPALHRHCMASFGIHYRWTGLSTHQHLS